MKKFEQELKQKAHLNKIKNAKKTVNVPNKHMPRMSSIKTDEAQVLLNLYEKKRFDSIPAYKLLRMAGLQQYTKGFIQRGYGIKLGSLSALSEKDKHKLYEDLKILPGHTVKLDKLIQTISRHSYMQPQQDLNSNFSQSDKLSYEGNQTGSNSKINDNRQHRNSKQVDKYNIDVNKLKLNEKVDAQYQKQLQRVFNQYTPNTNEKNKQKKQNLFKEDSPVASSGRSGKVPGKATINFDKLKVLQERQLDLQRKLQKVSHQFTPLGDDKDKKKRTFQQKVSDKKTPTLNSGQLVRKYSKTKYIPNTKPQQADFKKKTSTIENRPNAKKIDKVDSTKVKSGISASTEASKKLKNMINFGAQQPQLKSTSKIMQIQFQLDKIKALNRSFDGSLMSSTIANIDIEQLVYAFSGYVCATVIAAPEPTDLKQSQFGYEDDKNMDEKFQMEQSIEDEVGNILRQSYLHPLYTNNDGQVDQDIQGEQHHNQNNEATEYLANSEGQQQQDLSKPHNQFLQVGETQNLQQSSVSSFLGGESYHFGLEQPLHIFNEPEPSQLDYYKPTVDSVANFIKNIVLTAKMQRQIPIMAAHYLHVFLSKTGLSFTSLNYKRILVTLLLLASKIWDDQSFQSPSFSKTFPQYTTVLLNQMEKQVLKALDYKLKLDKKQFAQIYFQLRKYARKNLRSCQNKKIQLKKIRELQAGQKKHYKSNFLQKRNSF